MVLPATLAHHLVLRSLILAAATANLPLDAKGAGHEALKLTNTSCMETNEGVSLLQLVTQVADRVPPLHVTSTHGKHRDSHPFHKVEHILVLNDTPVWILMAAVVIGMSLIVIRLEVARAEPGGATHLPPAKEPLPVESDQERRWTNIGIQWLDAPWVRLALCFVALQVSMLLWGIAQEWVMTNSYGLRKHSDGTITKVDFSPSFPILFNRLFSMLFFGSVLLYLGKMRIFDGFWMSGAPALTNACASYCQYASLNYISFALQTTAKTTKLLPVVVIDSLRGKPQTLLDYAEAITLVAAMMVFGLEIGQLPGSEAIQFHSTAIGVMLLVGLICFDSATTHLQDWLFDKHPTLSSVHVMFSTAAISCVVLLVAELFSGTLFSSLRVLWEYPLSFLHLIVLAASSAIVQYFLVFTNRQFGPVVVTIIVSIRQMVSVMVSAVTFNHVIPPVAVIAMIMAFFIVFVRAMRKPIPWTRSQSQSQEIFVTDSWPFMNAQQTAIHRQSSTSSDASSDVLTLLERNYLGQSFNLGPFFKVAVAIHVLYGIYAVSQEFLAVHTFHQSVFAYPLFLVALNHSFALAFAVFALNVQGLPKCIPEMRFTALPAMTDLLATTMQHWSLYNMLFPTQTLIKTLKIVPVMIIGRVFGSRTYTTLDYIEGAVLTGLVAFFVHHFELESHAFTETQMASGIIMMTIYVIADSFTSPLQDLVYQNYNIDPGQMMLGLELISCTAAWIILLFNGQLWDAVSFLSSEPSAIFSVLVLAVCAAAGAYTCTLTVRLYGPAVFVLLMMSRQTMSLVISVLAFHHKFDMGSLLALVVVCLIVLVSSIRRVTLQLKEAQEKEVLKQEDAIAKPPPAG